MHHTVSPRSLLRCLRQVRRSRPLRGGLLALCGIAAAGRVHAQAGPPFLTNDPGTPGNANWEINLASMQTLSRGFASYQVPQIDLNFGVGERIQLTYELPYVVDTAGGVPTHGGWGNGYPGGEMALPRSGRGRVAGVRVPAARNRRHATGARQRDRGSRPALFFAGRIHP
jgi:hypothetical protein